MIHHAQGGFSQDVELCLPSVRMQQVTTAIMQGARALKPSPGAAESSPNRALVSICSQGMSQLPIHLGDYGDLTCGEGC